jgi:Fe-S-cluster containining protein
MYSPLQDLKDNKSQRRKLKNFLRKLELNKHRGTDALARKINSDAFREIDCLKCANCCKTMAPTFKKTEVLRIATHMKLTYAEYFKKYLKVDKEGDIMNRNTPCQHLGSDNMCSIYDIRPSDCSGFPHTHKRDFIEFIPETHIQNVDFCPATFYVVEKMFEKLNGIQGNS